MTDEERGCPMGYGSKPPKNVRKIEKTMESDFRENMSYADFLQLDKLLKLQGNFETDHDAMLFCIIHQCSELWIKLMVFELEAAMQDIKNREINLAMKKMSRICRIQENLIQSWSILTTLTATDFMRFRDTLAKSSGFQSYGYRTLEFLLGNKNEKMLAFHRHDKEVYDQLRKYCDMPSVYELSIEVLAEHFPIADKVLNRNFAKPYVPDDSVMLAWKEVYTHPQQYWQLYELGEKLADIEDNFQIWRFRHMRSVARIIGYRSGTGGSSGVPFLEKALDIRFFPELFDVRDHLEPTIHD